MRACWLKWVGRDWSISADYIWLNYSDANTGIEAAIGIASFTLGQYGIASPSDAMAFLGAAGIGAVASQSADFLREAKAKENPMYFLWKLNRNNRL